MERTTIRLRIVTALLAFACLGALTAGCGGGDDSEEPTAADDAVAVDPGPVEDCMADEGFPISAQKDEYTVLSYIDPAIDQELRDNAAGVYVTKPIEVRYESGAPFIDRESSGVVLVLVFDDSAGAQYAASQFPKIALSGDAGNIAWALLGPSDVAVQPTDDTRAFAAAVQSCGESA